jgi:hypothetical protein
MVFQNLKMLLRTVFGVNTKQRNKYLCNHNVTKTSSSVNLFLFLLFKKIHSYVFKQ